MEQSSLASESCETFTFYGSRKNVVKGIWERKSWALEGTQEKYQKHNTKHSHKYNDIQTPNKQTH